RRGVLAIHHHALRKIRARHLPLCRAGALRAGAADAGAYGLIPSLRGALATKQSILSLLVDNGLLRGACHRARIRATRWLAMTVWLFENRRRWLHPVIGRASEI